MGFGEVARLEKLIFEPQGLKHARCFHLFVLFSPRDISIFFLVLAQISLGPATLRGRRRGGKGILELQGTVLEPYLGKVMTCAAC